MPSSDPEKIRLNLRQWKQKNRAYVRERDRLYRARTRDALNEKRRARYRANREQNVLKQRAKRYRNIDKYRSLARVHYHRSLGRKSKEELVQFRKESRERLRHWCRDNPEKNRLIKNRRRVRLLSAAGSHTVQQWLSRVEYFGWRCRYCKCELSPSTLTKDHVKPLCRGGSDFASNLAPACRSCNSKKNAKSPLNFIGKEQFHDRGER